MGVFTNKIVAEFTPPKTWKLEEDLAFREGSLTKDDIELLRTIGANIKDSGRITCTKGMKTDLASTPRIIWGWISPWDVARAAIIHDHLYASLRKFYHDNVTESDSELKTEVSKKKWTHARALSDKIFLLGMKSADPKVHVWKIYPAYWAVRVFGRGPASTG
jgi:hypothetical protein|tara:strand:- start:995 stop:1480 length:486 start_codon:yes stop_codon:yes gene_type:complete